jgi:methylated-DNA-[protein]-cysteine S-methyltransferase
MKAVSFKEKVQAIVKKIPKGKTLTYKEVAIRVGNPLASRAVGNILHRNRDLKVPCHRVVRSDGTFGGYNHLRGLSKEALLKKEKAI